MTILTSFTDLGAWGSVIKDAIELGLIWSLLALGVFISFRILDFADLSIESSIVTGGAVSILFVNVFNFPPLLAFLLAFIVGCLCGALTGILHTLLKIPGILSGIIVMTALVSINMNILKVAQGVSSPTSLGTIKIGKPRLFMQFRDLLGNIHLEAYAAPILALLLVVAVFLILYWFFGTEFGMSLRSTGNNRGMSKAQGINTTLRIIIGLAISNGLVALCGALLSDTTRSISIDNGKGTIVVGLVSIILGEAIFGKKSFLITMISVVVGSMCYQFLYLIAINFFEIDPSDLKLAAAVLITIILFIPIVKSMKAKSVKLREMNAFETCDESLEVVGTTDDKDGDDNAKA